MASRHSTNSQSISNLIEYRDIPNLDGYRFGNDGSVWSCWKKIHVKGKRGFSYVLTDEWKQLRPFSEKSGYLQVTIKEGKKLIKHKVHRLILLAFKGECPTGMEVCHEDGNPKNNNICNLRYDTRSGNYKDRVRHGTDNSGERNGRSFLTSEIVKSIREDFSNGFSIKSISYKYNIKYINTWKIVNRKAWKHM